MRRPERSRPYQTYPRRLHPGHRIYLAGHYGFVRGHRRQDSGHGLSKCAFPASRRTDHYHVVPACGCYFEPPLGPFLAYDIREIRNLGCSRLLLPGGIADKLVVEPCIPDQKIAAVLLLLEDTEDVGECLHPEYREPAALGRLQGRPDRQDAPNPSHAGSEVRERKGPRHFPDRSIQTQLPHYQVFPYPGQLLLP